MNLLDVSGIPRHFAALAAVALVLLPAGCDFVDPPPPPPPPPPEPHAVHIALAGGGWRAHTAHAGWTMALLDDGKNTLADVFARVGTVSSNSGGSWFSTMLVYSGDFVTAIEAKNAISTWSDSGASATGWLGQQQYHFDKTGCQSHRGELFLACVLDAYGGAYWKDNVEELVFKDFPVSGPLSGSRQSWAKDKPLLLAATMLTSDAVLSATGWDDDKEYYQACLAPSTPVLNGYDGASCSGGGTAEVTPVTFSSVPTGSGSTPPRFFPAIGGNTGPASFNVGYTENALDDPAKATTTIENPVPSDQVPVMIAAAASSAAAGFGASYSVIKRWHDVDPWEEAYKASDEALNFQLEGGLKYQLATGMSVEELKDNKMVQIADGGPVDNSGVAQLVSFLQSNGSADGFDIVAFDNVQGVYQPSGSAPPIGIDLAYLFGKGLTNGNEFCSGAHGGGICVKVPDLQIFDLAALTDPSQLTWQAQDGKSESPPQYALIYTRYPVTTVENAAFGIAAGTKGTLHAFTCVWADADTAPQNETKDGDFKAYAAMLEFIPTGLRHQDKAGKTGMDYLEEALGL